MNTDIRISVSFSNHRKRKRLKMMLGPGSTDYLIDLWIATAMNRPSGVLSDMDEIDIALDAGWEGDPAEFVSALVRCGFMDFDGQTYSMHDWEDHQGYVVRSDVRTERAKKAAAKRWEGKGNAGEIQQACSEHAASMLEAMPETETSNAPSPAPAPLAKKNIRTPLPPTGGCDEKRTQKPTGQGEYPADFEAAWKVYPRKDGKRKAFQAWQKAIKRGMPVADMLGHIDSRAYEPDWLKDDGRFVPHMATWLNGDGWLDEGAKLPVPPPADNDDDFWRVDFYGNPLPPLHDREVAS